MTNRTEVIAFCKQLKNVYEDAPFHDPNWTLMRHEKNRKVFAWIFEKLDGTIPDKEIKRMLEESYDITKPKQKKLKN
ncbi:MAG TPA: MmcQ/YjbR family DNA-binding protein [Lachnospiraceae bacterium]|nr:MmcQ/YjbR family DNA-binding protein [Lachnospiraceae bacterium]